MFLETAMMMVQNHDSFHWASGDLAEFCSIDGFWGVKIYFEHSQLSNPKEMRDKCYRLQWLASQHELAPKVDEVFQTKLPSGKTAYGFITECVEYVYMDFILAEEGYNGLDDPELPIDDAVTFEEEFDLAFPTINLLKQINRIGITTNDMHWANIGRLRGKRVAFDFSHEGLA